jgi:hypothetical protein
MYGLRLSGLPAPVGEHLVPVEPGAPEVAVELHLGSNPSDNPSDDAWCSGDTLVLARAGGPRHEVRRSPPSGSISVVAPPTPAVLAQPLLVIIAAAHNRWRGALTLHGAAFEMGGRAWALVAEKEGGKSTIMAGLASRGIGVLTDDLVVVHEGDVLPGPRGVDLRPATAERLGKGVMIGVVAGQPRYRITVPAPPLRVPLAGIVSLCWSRGPGVSIDRLNVEERLRCVAGNEALGVMGPQPVEVVFDVIGLPMYRLSRPRSWDVHEEVLDSLVALASG